MITRCPFCNGELSTTNNHSCASSKHKFTMDNVTQKQMNEKYVEEEE